MDALALQREGEDWRLCLNGDWALRGMAPIDDELRALPGPASGTLICDWSHAERPGIGPVWALLGRLADLGGSQLGVRHEGAPPHTLEPVGELRLALPGLFSG